MKPLAQPCDELTILLDSSTEELINQTFGVYEAGNEVSQYRLMLVAYFKCDLVLLQHLSCDPSLPLHLQKLAKIRFEIRQKSGSDYSRWKNAFDDVPPVWLGEAHFVLSFLAADLGLNQEFLDHSIQAAKFFEEMGAKKRAIKALMNCVVAKSRLQLDAHWISEHYAVFKKARKAKAHDSAGVCLSNIAKEYQTLGAYSSALLYSNRAMQYLDRNRGSFNYYMTLVQRSHIYLALGRYPEARLDFEMASDAKFHEVIAARAVLSKDLSPRSDCRVELSHLTPAWQERFASSDFKVRIGGLEDKLIRYLSEGSLSSSELAIRLYGTQIDPFSAESRLKTLLVRVRKKHKGLIVFNDGYYSLGDPLQRKSLEA